MRTSNFIPITLEVVPSTKLTFLKVAARFVTQAQPQPTRAAGGSPGRLSAHFFPASGCSGARARPLLACEIPIYTQQ